MVQLSILIPILFHLVFITSKSQLKSSTMTKSFSFCSATTKWSKSSTKRPGSKNKFLVKLWQHLTMNNFMRYSKWMMKSKDKNFLTSLLKIPQWQNWRNNFIRYPKMNLIQIQRTWAIVIHQRARQAVTKHKMEGQSLWVRYLSMMWWN